MARSAIFTQAAEFWQLMKTDWDAQVLADYQRAERDTNGVLFNRAGQAAHIDAESLFVGPLTRAEKYASEELKEHWNHFPRRSFQEYERQWAEGRMFLVSE